MAKRTLDLDLRLKGTFGEIFGRPRTLAWPVQAFRITIPDLSRGERDYLNPFERVILKLIGVTEGSDEATLARDTRLPVDLVRNVIARLRDRGIVNEDNRLARPQIGGSALEMPDEEYVTAMVLRELVGGRVLPFVRILDFGHALKTKMTDERGKLLPTGHGTNFQAPPSTREVINAISQMSRYSRRRPPMPSAAQVRIGREPEDYLLECSIVIQMHDADFRIANPFGVGFSSILETAFGESLNRDPKLQRWMLDWRNQLAAPNNDARSYVVERAPFDTTENRRRFPKLVEILKPSRGESYRPLSAIYHSLEWALFYTCQTYETSIPVQQLSLETGPEYSNWMSNIVRTIGFDVPATGFRPVRKGRLNAFSMSSEADMETVMAICLLQAEGHSDHPLRRIADVYPDFLVRVWSLKRERDGLGHGRDRGVRGAGDVPMESDAFMQAIVRTMLPSILFEKGASGTLAPSQADRRLDARTSLLSTFGHSVFRKLGPTAQESLLHAELFSLACRDEDDAREFVFNVYSTLQGVLSRFLTSMAPSELPEEGYLAIASHRARLAELGHLPPEFGTVNLRRVRESLHGNDTTLGASALALLLKASDSFLHRLALEDPHFLATIASIHVVRGHGNESVPMSIGDVAKMRRAAFASLNALLTNED